MKDHVFVSLRLLVVFTLLLGFGYPAAVWAVGRVAFPGAAGGSFVARNGAVVGSSLIGQAVTSPGLFRPRPFAAGSGYDAAASSGSNLGPTSRKLRDRVAADVARLRAENPQAPAEVPIELVTTSASGLDPHLSPAAATWQVARVAASRGVPLGEVQALLDARIEARTFGLFGEPRVNVLLLNLDLDRRFGRPAPAGLEP